MLARWSSHGAAGDQAREPSATSLSGWSRTDILAAALTRYDDLVSRGPSIGQNMNAKESMSEDGRYSSDVRW
jgi:hypothetical protein